jgi:hypothetical protein
MLYSLIYGSFSTEQFDRDKDEALKNISKASRYTNTNLNITGMLLYDGTFFLQYLEGTKEEVKQIYSVISSDHRHRNLFVLNEGELGDRHFPHWAMKINEIQSIDLETLKVNYNWRNLILSTKNNNEISFSKLLNVFKYFR